MPALPLLAFLTVAGLVQAAAPAPDGIQLSSVKVWSAEIVVTSECNRLAFDGSRTVIHNRIVTTYEFSRRVGEPSALKWSGRASTTYRWAVGMETRDGKDIEESSGTFDTDAELDLNGSTKITAHRPTGQPFTRRKFQGDALLDTQSYQDEPPQAELFEAPLPGDDGTLSGERVESAYSLLAGLVLTCPAQRRWTVHAGAPAKKP